MRATLYVKGVRIKQVKITGGKGYYIAYKPMSDTAYEYPDFRAYKETTYKSVLSEDQKALVEMVKSAAVKYGFELKIIDVSEKRFLDALDTRMKRIRSFPTLVTNNGLRVEGDITEERIKALFTK